MINRQAEAVMFGFQFQVNAGIYLMLKYFSSFVSLKIEGKNEDIELNLEDSKKIYAQAKSKYKPYENISSAAEKFDKALISFRDVPTENLLNYIYITNMDTNPINSKSSEFGGENYYYFDDLQEETQKYIYSRIKKANLKINAHNLIIVTIPFFGKDNDQKKKTIKNNIEEFMSKIAPELKSYSKQLMNNWETDFFNNGTVKNPSITINKKNIVWNLIVFKISEDNTDRLIDTLSINETDFIDAMDKYEEIINLKETDFLDYNRIIRLYQQESIKNSNLKLVDFLNNKEEEIFEIIFPDYEVNYKKFDKKLFYICSKIISYKIILRKNSIEKIQKGVNNYEN